MRESTTQEKVERFMEELGRAVQSPGTVYFTGGVCAVLKGWRETTLDIDVKADPEPAGFFEALPKLKNAIDVNIELASPGDFVPPLPRWRERSEFIAKRGLLSFFHYDFYGQALSKIERDHARDRRDVARMILDDLIQPDRLRALFAQAEAELIRYPAVDAEALKRRVECLR
jgi:hypothetical protein